MDPDAIMDGCPTLDALHQAFNHLALMFIDDAAGESDFPILDSDIHIADIQSMAVLAGP